MPAIVLAVTATACGTESPFRDGCAVHLRYGGVTYVDAGFSDRHVERLGRAQVLTCSAIGRRGPGTVSAWAFPGHDPREVVAVEDRDVYRVFLAEGLSEAERQRIAGSRLMDAGEQ